MAELLLENGAATLQVATDVEATRRFDFLGPDVDTNAVKMLGEVPERAVLAYGVPALGRLARRFPSLRYRFLPANTTISRQPSAKVRLPGGEYVELQARADEGLFLVTYALAADAMLGSPPLAETDHYQAAVKALGKGFRPSLYFRMPGALALARRAFGTNSGGQAEALRYLRRVASVVSGDRVSGDRLVTCVTVNLR